MPDILVPLIIATIVVLIFIVIIIVVIRNNIKKKNQMLLLNKVLDSLSIKKSQLDILFDEYDKGVIVRSKQSFKKYDYVSVFKEDRKNFELMKNTIVAKEAIINNLKKFLKDNNFKNEKEYSYVEKYFVDIIAEGAYYIVHVDYITQSDNELDEKDLKFSLKRINDIENTPELYMTKTEIKEIEKAKVENRKKDTYSRVNNIIDKANLLKERLLIKKDNKILDDLIAKLFDRTVNSIQKIKQINSEEWDMINSIINDVEKDVLAIERINNNLSEYYSSNEFETLKKTCELLMNSQKDFNSYIEEKIESLSKMYGTRVVRNETEHGDEYNYVRKYNKTISPFTAELSSTVFGSAENNPIQYLIKCFYPNKSLYKEQIVGLKNLLNELEALKDAKTIIENYKTDYQKYIENVPRFVLEEDSDGFYSRLGFAVIDESVLNVEYKFVYTSDGGKAQRSFTIPMTEENISELINQLQDKLSSTALAKEQRALMTPKLRLFIKERDNYTCCICGNSINNEPNLLLEIDHKIPIARGGLTVEENLQTLCWKCNRNKGAKIN